MAEKNRFWRFARQHADELANGVDEAEIKHLIGFVEHENLDLGEIDGAPVEQIDEPAGCGDEDVDAALQSANLVVDRHAAENDGMREPQIAAIGAE